MCQGEYAPLFRSSCLTLYCSSLGNLPTSPWQTCCIRCALAPIHVPLRGSWHCLKLVSQLEKYPIFPKNFAAQCDGPCHCIIGTTDRRDGGDEEKILPESVQWDRHSAEDCYRHID